MRLACDCRRRKPEARATSFFTTKPDGSGIGLPLSRQIAEAHDGTLVLINREDRQGVQALLRLPRN